MVNGKRNLTIKIIPSLLESRMKEKLVLDIEV